jgi:hypothetical protein
MALSSVTDIRLLFRDGDIQCMGPSGVKLVDPTWMCAHANAQSVYSQISTSTMLPDAP